MSNVLPLGKSYRSRLKHKMIAFKTLSRHYRHFKFRGVKENYALFLGVDLVCTTNSIPDSNAANLDKATILEN